jgi:hypothetical protein
MRHSAPSRRILRSDPESTHQIQLPVPPAVTRQEGTNLGFDAALRLEWERNDGE